MYPEPTGAVSVGDGRLAKQPPASPPQARIVAREAGQVVDGIRKLRIFPIHQHGDGSDEIAGIEVAVGRHRRDREGGAIQRELPCTRDHSIDLRSSSRIALEDGLSLPCRDEYRIERREALGGRYPGPALYT